VRNDCTSTSQWGKRFRILGDRTRRVTKEGRIASLDRVLELLEKHLGFIFPFLLVIIIHN
jgi:hypothetical protein